MYRLAVANISIKLGCYAPCSPYPITPANGAKSDGNIEQMNRLTNLSILLARTHAQYSVVARRVFYHMVNNGGPIALNNPNYELLMPSNGHAYRQNVIFCVQADLPERAVFGNALECIKLILPIVAGQPIFQ